MLSPVALRIVGVLAEKEQTVPDSYPLTENALLAGCNQKSNRDPEMDLELADVRAELPRLAEDGWIHRVEASGGRSPKYRHELGTLLGVEGLARAVLTELLVRGPQAVGALRGRMGRFGHEVQNSEVEAVLHRLASRTSRPLVAELPRRPKERDNRWGHLLGSATDTAAPTAQPAQPAARPAAAATPAATPAAAAPAPAPASPDWSARITALEARVAELEARLEGL